MPGNVKLFTVVLANVSGVSVSLIAFPETDRRLRMRRRVNDIAIILSLKINEQSRTAVAYISNRPLSVLSEYLMINLVSRFMGSI